MILDPSWFQSRHSSTSLIFVGEFKLMEVTFEDNTSFTFKNGWRALASHQILLGAFVSFIILHCSNTSQILCPPETFEKKHSSFFISFHSSSTFSRDKIITLPLSIYWNISWPKQKLEAWEIRFPLRGHKGFGRLQSTRAAVLWP